MSAKSVVVSLTLRNSIKISKWKVKEGTMVSVGRVILLYEPNSGGPKTEVQKMKATAVGTVRKLLAREGDIVEPGHSLLELEKCTHPTVMKDMCAECGADLRNEETSSDNVASIPMVHNQPELKVNAEQAQILGKADEERLLANQKLVLLVDLDQTLIHTTNDNIPPNLKDVYHFQLHGSISPWHHTRLRPGTKKFLKEMSNFYELHICTFGSNPYAHKIAEFLDPDKQYFSQRILSRDECFSANSKTANLKALFPCGDEMVCIIDDREDVWNFAPNLIHVKPYHFFQHTGDINAPPGLSKQENDDMGEYDFNCLGDGKKAKDIFRPIMKNEVTQETQQDAINLVKGKSSEVCVNESTVVVTQDEVSDKIASQLETDTIKADFTSENQSKETVTKAQDNEVKVAQRQEAGNSSVQTPGSVNPDVLNENIQRKDTGERDQGDNDVHDKTQISEDPCEIMKEKNVGHEKHQAAEEFPQEQNGDKLEENVQRMDSGDETGVANDDANKIEITKEACERSEEEKLGNESAQSCGDEKPVDNTTLKAENKEEYTSQIFDNSKCKAAEAQTPISGAGNKSIVEEIEVEDHDDYLLYLEEILKRIHKEFYDSLAEGCKPDMKNIIPAVRKKVLEGTNLVFSGLVPNNIPLEKSRAYQVAVSLGANVTQDLKKNTTHLVAVRPGTAKVNSARRMKNVRLVTADWLWVSAERWERVDEKVFPLGRNRAGTRHPPAHCGSPEHTPVGRDNHAQPTTSSGRSRTASGRFMDTINPLLSLSSADIADMDQEVDEIFDESESDGDGEDSGQNVKSSSVPEMESESEEDCQPTDLRPVKNTLQEDSESSSSSADSLSGEHPHGWGKHELKRKRPDYKFTGTATESDGDEEAEDMPSTKFRRGEALPSDLDLGENESDSPPSEDPPDPDEMDDGDWNMMGAALEREFLS